MVARLFEDAEVIAANSEAAGGAVIPLHKHLQPVGVLNLSPERDTSPDDLDSVTNTWDQEFFRTFVALPHAP